MKSEEISVTEEDVPKMDDIEDSSDKVERQTRGSCSNIFINSKQRGDSTCLSVSTRSA